MDISQFQVALGLASTAVTVTGQAASTAEMFKKLFSSDKAPDSGEAAKLLNSLAVELTTANMMNVQLSDALKKLGEELRKEDEFEKEKSRYEVFTTSEGDIVYKLRAEMADGEPIHYVCPACLKKDRLIIFIQGSGDYKRCQVDSNHLYQFSETHYDRSGYAPL